MNTSAATFTSTTQNTYSKKVRAEQYMRTYQYAAEDFTTIPDIQTFITSLTEWMESVDTRLEAQMQLISKHTHVIPPHIHISGSAGYPTSPTPLVTLIPVTSPAIKWVPIPYPVYINTTGTIPNMTGNMVTIGTGSEGDVIPDYRRLKPIAITLTPLMTPAIQDSLTPSVG